MRFFSIVILLVTNLLSAKANNDGLRFIENKGQWNNAVLYKADLGSGVLFIEQKSFTYNLYNSEEIHQNHFTTNQHPIGIKYHAFRVNFLNALTATVSSSENFPEYYNYFLGKDKSKWKSNVAAYKLINYENIYNNINIQIYSLGNLLKYDVILNSSSNINDVQLNYEGADNLKITKSGNLIIKTSVGEIVEEKPYAYQNINNTKVEVPCEFVLKNNTLSFKINGKYNTKFPLIIDPILIFASYSGSTADNFGMTATYGYDGSLFAGGTAFNVGYPTTLGAYDPSFNGIAGNGLTDVVITRYDSTGSTLIYSTYIGGIATETVHSLIANENNELYLYGATSSLDFPTDANSFDNTFNGGSPVYYTSNGSNFTNGTDIYVAKLSANGTTLLGSTYLGGSLNDGVNSTTSLNYDTLMNNYGDQYRGEIMLDQYNNCYIASSTKSTNFPIINGFDNTLNGNQDAIIVKMNSDLSNVIWSSYLGGNNVDAGNSIKIDTSGYVYICGGTASNDFPTTIGAMNTSYLGGKTDGYICKIDTNGSQIIVSTFIGTSDYDQCYFVEIDCFGSIYTVGQTRGTFPIINAPYNNPNSSNFIVKLDNSLSSIDYSTLFGNGGTTTKFSPSAFLIDSLENIYVSGWGGDIMTSQPLTGMPTTPAAFQPNSPNGFDFYLMVLEKNAQSLLYGTYYGGSLSQEHVDGGTSRFDKNGIVYQSVCAGCWNNDDFPTTPGAWSNTNNSTGCNNGVFKFDFEVLQLISSISSPIVTNNNDISIINTNDRLRFDLKDITFSYFEIYNTSGQLILKSTINEQIFNVNTSKFSSGIYIIQLIGKSSLAKKVVIN